MPYDKNLDEQLFVKEWENDVTVITVSIYAYNKGTPKLQITRQTKTNLDERKYTKLGRMTKEEIEGILPFVQEAIQNM